jgi:hypothetical protein
VNPPQKNLELEETSSLNHVQHFYSKKKLIQQIIRVDAVRNWPWTKCFKKGKIRGCAKSDEQLLDVKFLLRQVAARTSRHTTDSWAEI